MYETDESMLSPEARAALDALRRCSLFELHAIRMHFLGLIQREVGGRVVEECRERVRREFAPVLRIAPDTVRPDHVIDGAVVPDETDEDGDEVLEPTPLEEPDPMCGPAWSEGGGPVS